VDPTREVRRFDVACDIRDPADRAHDPPGDRPADAKADRHEDEQSGQR
jgi:hypothetical protein